MDDRKTCEEILAEWDELERQFWEDLKRMTKDPE